MRCILSVALFSAVLQGTTGCDESTPPVAMDVPATAPAEPVVRQAETGPVRLTVTADRDRFTIPEQMHVAVRVEAELGVEVGVQAFEGFMGPFAIADVKQSTPDCGESTQCVQWTYTLDGILPGTHEVPALTAKFRDAREKADGSSGVYEDVVTTEPMPIVVSHDLADIDGPVALPMPLRYRLMLWAAGVVGAMVAFALLVRGWRRHRADVAAALPYARVVAPHVWALGELDKLDRENLVGRGLFHDYYYRVNGLLRGYVELRFGLMAGEQTSEEFLRSLADDSALSPHHKELLERFVAACDPVKYAKQIPGREEAVWVGSAARSFVVQTAGVADETRGATA